MKTYQSNAIWPQINAMLPEDIGINDSCSPTEESFQWEDSSIHFDRFANPESPVKVILHHGVGTNGRLLSMITGAPLARLGYEVVAVDMPFYGMTENNEPRIIYDDWIAISRAVIQAEQQKDGRPIVLYGLSAGGMLCYHVACLEPDIKGVVGMCFLDVRDLEVNRIISRFPLPGIVEG